MRSIAWAFLLSSVLLLTSGREQSNRVINVSTADDLQAAFHNPLENVTVQLAPGTYDLTPTNTFEPSTNYCGANSALVPATIGLTISGRGVTLRGPDQGVAMVVTNASHGIYVKDCNDCVLDHLVVSGSATGKSSSTACGSVTVKASLLHIANCLIRKATNGQQDDSLSSDLCLLDGAVATVESSEFTANSLGIHISAGAQVTIRNNLISAPDGGSSTGIRVDCTGKALVERNLIRHGATGIQLSEKANVTFRANIIENNVNVGIDVAGNHDLRAVLEENVIYNCATGVRLEGAGSGPTGKLSRNLIVASGSGGPMATSNLKEKFAINRNTFHDSMVGDDDVGREAFWRARRNWTRTYRNTPVGVDGRHKFHESAFLTRYGRWMD